MKSNARVESVKFNNFEMEYITFGNGSKPFVIIAGLSLKSVMLSANVIEERYSALKDDYTFYVFEGRKEINGEFTLYDMADDIASVIKELKISDAILLGASRGGMVAQIIAIKYPKLVSKLILASTLSKYNETSKSVIDKWIELAKIGDVSNLCLDMFSKIYSEDTFNKNKNFYPAFIKMCSKEDCRKFILNAKACLGFDVYDKLSSIKCPVFVIGAKEDKVLTVDGSKEIAEKLKCQIYIYEKYGHAVYDEAPDYIERIYEFIK